MEASPTETMEVLLCLISRDIDANEVALNLSVGIEPSEVAESHNNKQSWMPLH